MTALVSTSEREAAFYPADELVDLLAVSGVPSLRQGGEGAGLHVLLTGLFVLTLKMERTQIHSEMVLRGGRYVLISKGGKKVNSEQIEMVDIHL